MAKNLGLEDITEEEIKVLDNLRKRNIQPSEANKLFSNKYDRTQRNKYDLTDGKEFKFALIGDTHFGNKSTNKEALDAFYKYAVKHGYTQFFHCGDLVDGLHVHVGQEFEQYALGFDEQVKDVVNDYPTYKNVKTYYILGNHDLYFKKNAGANIGDVISKERSDLVYLGIDEADIKIGNGTILRISHPGGGCSYALSYRLQKQIEAIQGGTKPNILGVGHYHKSMQMMYRNVAAYLVGCFEEQTPFMRSKGLSAAVGGWLVTGKSGKHGGLKEISGTYIPFMKVN